MMTVLVLRYRRQRLLNTITILENFIWCLSYLSLLSFLFCGTSNNKRGKLVASTAAAVAELQPNRQTESSSQKKKKVQSGCSTCCIRARFSSSCSNVSAAGTDEEDESQCSQSMEYDDDSNSDDDDDHDNDDEDEELPHYCVDQSEDISFFKLHNRRHIDKKTGRRVPPDYICTQSSLDVRYTIDRHTMKVEHNTATNYYANSIMPLETVLEEYDSNFGYYDSGVEQNIDGTPEQKLATEEVIRLMNHYLLQEVLAHREYEPVRRTCKNTHHLCAFWASVGECETAREFMLMDCAPACRLCLLAATNK